MKSFIDTYSKIANGFITWGQSDSLTWYHCINPTTKENFNAHIIDMNGVPKKEWNILKKIMNPEEKNKNVCINEYEGIVRKDEVKNNKFIEELQNQVNTDITQFKSSENNKKEKEMSLDDVVR